MVAEVPRAPARGASPGSPAACAAPPRSTSAPGSPPGSPSPRPRASPRPRCAGRPGSADPEAVARICDVPTVVPTLLGKVEFEMGEEGRERDVLDHLLKVAIAETFRARLAGLDLSGFTDLFAEGAVVETGELVPAADLLQQLGTVPGPVQGPRPARPRRRRLPRAGRRRGRVRAGGPAPDPPDRQGHRGRPDRLRRRSPMPDRDHVRPRPVPLRALARRPGPAGPAVRRPRGPGRDRPRRAGRRQPARGAARAAAPRAGRPRRPGRARRAGPPDAQAGPPPRRPRRHPGPGPGRARPGPRRRAGHPGRPGRRRGPAGRDGAGHAAGRRRRAGAGAGRLRLAVAGGPRGVRVDPGHAAQRGPRRPVRRA